MAQSPFPQSDSDTFSLHFLFGREDRSKYGGLVCRICVASVPSSVYAEF